jgi:prepilin-type N-terminal cleavage/methylation domain-containing protein
MSIFWNRNVEMTLYSDNLVSDSFSSRAGRNAFTLVEVVSALTILALISSGMLVVINRCTISATDSRLKMQAFEVAREQMETLLASDSLKENVEYGVSQKYPDIAWQTVVESFYEPITARMWIRGVCSAQYKDSNGEDQTIELTQWLTDLTKEQLLAMMNQGSEEDLEGMLFETLEEAAEYAGVDVETIEEWIENGMVTTEDGFFIKNNLDLFKNNDGQPSEEEKKQQIKSESELLQRINSQGGENSGSGGDWQNEVDPKTGLTYGELENMDFFDVLELMKSKQ